MGEAVEGGTKPKRTKKLWIDEMDVTVSVNDKEQNGAPAGPQREPEGKETPDEGFTRPKKVSKLSKIISQQTPTKIDNKYEPLAGPSTTVEDRIATNTTKRPAGKQARASLPPPIILKGKPQNHTDLVAEIKKHINGEFFIKYTGGNTNLYINNLDEYRHYKRTISQDNVEFYTYTIKEEKKHAFVLKGLSEGVDVEEVKEELENTHGVRVHEIYKMKNRANIPMYLITVDNTITLKILQTEVKFVNYTKIKWERRVNTRTITQCRRCQVWGHATSNCHMAPRCSRCAAPHLSWHCQKTTETPAKCCNCGGDHPASSVTCPVYQKIADRQKKEEAQPQQKRTLVPAPLPKTNSWTGRSQAGGAAPPTGARGGTAGRSKYVWQPYTGGQF